MKSGGLKRKSPPRGLFASTGSRSASRRSRPCRARCGTRSMPRGKTSCCWITSWCGRKPQPARHCISATFGAPVARLEVHDLEARQPTAAAAQHVVVQARREVDVAEVVRVVVEVDQLDLEDRRPGSRSISFWNGPSPYISLFMKTETMLKSPNSPKPSAVLLGQEHVPGLGGQLGLVGRPGRPTRSRSRADRASGSVIQAATFAGGAPPTNRLGRAPTSSSRERRSPIVEGQVLAVTGRRSSRPAGRARYSARCSAF